jgi:thioredoxin-like negative regulator of GroEL
VDAPRQSAPGESLLEKGRLFAERGQSLRAEQYFLAAREAGAAPGEVLVLLVDTCIKSGRYRSALSHVEARLLDAPFDQALRELAIALRRTLGINQPERLAEPAVEKEHS